MEDSEGQCMTSCLKSTNKDDGHLTEEPLLGDFLLLPQPIKGTSYRLIIYFGASSHDFQDGLDVSLELVKGLKSSGSPSPRHLLLSKPNPTGQSGTKRVGNSQHHLRKASG